MTMDASVLGGDHKRRMRRRSTALSYFLAPFVIVACGIWILFNAIVCAGGSASPSDLFLCRHAGWLPGAVVVLALVDLVWLVVSLNAYAEEVLRRTRKQEDWRVPHYARNARHAYSTFDNEHKAIVFFALEMSVWSTSAVILVLTFYFFELAFPLGLLAVAALVRIVYAIVRLILRFGRGRPTQASTTSSSARS